MAFRFIRSAGSVHEPAVIHMPASGVVHVGGVVIADASNYVVSPATSALATSTAIIGVSMDYAQGASDTFVRVIPFVPGQLWEADAANVITTANILQRHVLVNDLVVRNTGFGTTTSMGESGSVGVFLCYAVTGLATGSGKLIGTFLQRSAQKGDGFAIGT